MTVTTLTGPYFIGVGPEKTGTSWIFQNLLHHPDIWLVPPKELNYFYETLHHPQDNWSQRLRFDSTWYTRRYRRYLITRPGHLFKYPRHVTEPWRLLWDWEYIFSNHTDDWYRSAFRFVKQHQRGGEISPSYFFLPEEGIAHLQRVAPDAKIILSIRNPVDWCWSFAKMSLMKNKGRKIDQVPESEFKDFFDARLGYASFSDAIARWRKYFPEKQVSINFFDEISDNPQKLMMDICLFLDIDQNKIPERVWNNLSRKVNAGKKEKLPRQFGIFLATGFLPEVEKLCAMFDGYPHQWKAELESIVQE